MSKNGIILCVLALILGGIYVVYFTGLFNKEYIEIIPQIRPTRPSAIPRNDPTQAPVYPVFFMLRGKFPLTSIKVVSAEDAATNKHPAPLWHMIADTTSVPSKGFYYGERLQGMKPAVPKARPLPLLPETVYILMVEAGKAKGKTNFHTREVVRPTT